MLKCFYVPTNVKTEPTPLEIMKVNLKYTVKMFELTFEFNAMFVRQVKNIISNFRLDWNPLSGPVDIHHINTRVKNT